VLGVGDLLQRRCAPSEWLTAHGSWLGAQASGRRRRGPQNRAE
jgi:hypothetical protein